MTTDAIGDAERALLDALGAVPPSGVVGDPSAPVAPGSALSGSLLRDVFDAALCSRHLDHAARWLRGKGLGFYTIGSAGHEANAFVAAALRPTDPALLHYRSGGFYLCRALQVPGHDGVDDVLRGLLAAADEPIAGGRHKVFGNHALAVVPQTSTIASHLPRAVGVAWSIGRADAPAWPDDALAVCSFGDASLNHSTAQGALNAAGHFAHRGVRLPLLFVCEDNGLGISVPSPDGWVAAALSARPGLRYEHADGTDPVAVFDVTEDLAEHVRETGRPGVLHLGCVRYGGHAGTDVEAAYRSAAAMRADLDRDPLVAAGRVLVARGICSPADLVARWHDSRRRVRDAARALFEVERLKTAEQVIAPLAPRRPAQVAEAVARARRSPATGTSNERLTLAESINRALAELLDADPGLLVFGEDVGVKGGVYGVTRGLQKQAGSERVFDTLLDEQTILGLALGAAVSGLLPVPEIQYLAYVHNAIDQLRGEAATLSFFSQGQYRNGMVVRIAGYAYQKGFGGHFHNDNSVGGLRDIPGVVVASPSNGADAAAMLRTCAAAARVDGTVSVFLEPIALYHTRDLLADGDGGWLSDPESAGHVALGEPRVAHDGDDVLLVSWANGAYLSSRVADAMQREGIGCRVLDLRWLVPLPIDELLRHADAVGRVIVVDETRHQGGVGEAVVTALVDGGYRGALRRIAARDSFVPLGDAANLVLVGEDEIAAEVRAIIQR
jgi:2-oxoisovalerate dehydrogenase E1 component